MIPPLLGAFKITSKFGYRTDPFSGKSRFHSGDDLDQPDGSPVVAMMNGVVVDSVYKSSTGNTIAIYSPHDGWVVEYHHLQDLPVKVGDTVREGDVVGHLGNTGTRSTGGHLHVNMIETLDGKTGTYVDPYTFWTTGKKVYDPRGAGRYTVPQVPLPERIPTSAPSPSGPIAVRANPQIERAASFKLPRQVRTIIPTRVDGAGAGAGIILLAAGLALAASRRS